MKKLDKTFKKYMLFVAIFLALYSVLDFSSYWFGAGIGGEVVVEKEEINNKEINKIEISGKDKVSVNRKDIDYRDLKNEVEKLDKNKPFELLVDQKTVTSGLYERVKADLKGILYREIRYESSVKEWAENNKESSKTVVNSIN